MTGPGMIFTTTSGTVTVVTLSQPPVNAISEQWVRAFDAILDDLAGGPPCTVLHIRSDQKVFCAGADLREVWTHMEAPDGAERMYAYVAGIQRLYARIERLPQVVLAEIGGAAMGGGLELALCADIIVAGDSAKLGLPEVKLGILAGGGGTQKLARLVGRQRAMLLLMTGRMFGAAEAFDMGIVGEVAPAGQALARALETAKEIAAMPAISVLQIKELVNAGLNAPLETALMLERKAFQLQFATRDQKEGMKAFLEKRKPVYEGK